MCDQALQCIQLYGLSALKLEQGRHPVYAENNYYAMCLFILLLQVVVLFVTVIEMVKEVVEVHVH